MCGIAGIHRFSGLIEGDTQRVQNAVTALRHRGPDDAGLHNDAHTALGHARLSIIDTHERARQPMSDALGRYHLIYNGEIFNFRELRARLTAAGVPMHTESDTEVLLHLLIGQGLEALNLLNGFFAFAFWDSHEQRLWLVRDRFGVKPLWYAHEEGVLSFASETTALRKLHTPGAIQANVLCDYFRFTFLPGNGGVQQGISRLEPGCYLEASAGRVRTGRWYVAPSVSSSALTYTDAAARLDELLSDAVKQRLVSDVPLGSFLSGGIDSSLIAAMACRYRTGLQTFSIGFKAGSYLDESSWSLKVAKHIGSEHHLFRITEEELLAHVDDMLYALDEPFADSSAIAVYVLSKMVKQHVTVALSGDGADELLAGYNRHWAMWRTSRLRKAPLIWRMAAALAGLAGHSRESLLANRARQLVRMVQLCNTPFAKRYFKLAAFTDENTLQRALIRFTPTGNEESLIHAEDLNTLLMADQKFILPGDMLVKVDLMSMAHALEVRTPFLDYRVVEFANSLPFDYKLRHGVRKAVLREVAAKYLPAEILERSKQGFEVPVASWLRGPLRYLLDEAADTQWLEHTGLFNSAGIAELKNDFLRPGRDEAVAFLWALVVFRRWYLAHYIS